MKIYLYLFVIVMSLWRLFHGYLPILDPIAVGNLKVHIFYLSVFVLDLWIILNFKKARQIYERYRVVYGASLSIVLLVGVLILTRGLLINQDVSLDSIIFFNAFLLFLLLEVAFEHEKGGLQTMINIWLGIHGVRTLFIFLYEVALKSNWFQRLHQIGNSTDNINVFDRVDHLAALFFLIAVSTIQEKTTYQKVLTYLILPISLLLIIIDNTRTIFLILALLSFHTFKYYFSIRQHKVFLLTFVMAVTLIGLFNSALIEKYEQRLVSINNFDKDRSVEYRLILWGSALTKIYEKPLLGWGPGEDTRFDVRRYSFGKRKYIDDTNATVHNVYLQVAIWGGLLIVIATVYNVLRVMWVNSKLNSSNDPPYIFIGSINLILATDLLYFMTFPGSPDIFLWLGFHLSIGMYLGRHMYDRISDHSLLQS
ncbi:MAG: O-antigen ligase family protein [Candidatus Marinimicrobia bacterium]|nr:O-antigen ligase family protein [Candidatus Neomarinimicrobiota bacterium]MCF7850189.1 O-antigen ligase family protein [Candidatus Neomarinimicrobiota bacterium]